MGFFVWLLPSTLEFGTRDYEFLHLLSCIKVFIENKFELFILVIGLFLSHCIVDLN